ncbi:MULTISPECIES: recombination protein NinG [Pseudomonas]|uniref:recombination protein NinG n=1 Tax=Pseudomonas TaxID=286 RepID=UPI000CFF83DB|nr:MULTISPECIES: recombination protein NinG [Pseudomonas]PRA53188.1 ninG protein [Pseudomonas sp. MYb115]QXN52210.1 recombination protein NinG [Pseudomonas fluorescens]WSO26540.1 recombination protein NinG [Pseudomonas fluorescens]
MIPKQPRSKTCKNPACRASFVPQRLGQAVCSYTCGLAIKDVNQERARKSLAQVERREIKVRKEKLKSRADHMRETQVVFNEFIRLRDAAHPCISCDSVSTDDGLITGSRWDAGHYRSVGSCPELRFEPLNVHRQCVRCNRNLSGNAVEYRIRLVQRIGAEELDWLEGPHEAQRYTVEELKAIKAKYRAMTRELKRAAA